MKRISHLFSSWFLVLFVTWVIDLQGFSHEKFISLGNRKISSVSKDWRRETYQLWGKRRISNKNDYIEKEQSENERRDESIDEEEEDEEEQGYMIGKNPVRAFVKKVFERIFFFGLETDPPTTSSSSSITGQEEEQVVSSGGRNFFQILESKAFQRFKRNNLENLFLTNNELVALFISSQKKNSSKKGEISEKKTNGRAETPAVLIPRNPVAIEKEIKKLNEEIQLLDVSLAAATEDGETDEEENDGKAELLRQRESLSERLKSLKVELVTIQEEEAELQRRM